MLVKQNREIKGKKAWGKTREPDMQDTRDSESDIMEKKKGETQKKQTS